MATSKAVAKQNDVAVEGSIQQWLVATAEPAEVQEVIEDLSRDGNFGPRDLPIVKIPSGGATSWEYPTAEGPEAGRYFDAVILHHHTHRKCWTAPYGGSQAGPPNCASDDGLVGIGVPGGVCATCRFNHVKEHRDDITCAPRKAIFLLFPDLALPVFFDLPVTSLVAFDKYVKTELGSSLRRAHHVLTRFELVKANARMGGEPYARLSISRVADVPREEREKIDAYRAAFVGAIEATYEAKKQLQGGLTSGGGGQQNLWERAPEAGIDEDDLPEIGEKEPPSQGQED